MYTHTLYFCPRGRRSHYARKVYSLVVLCSFAFRVYFFFSSPVCACICVCVFFKQFVARLTIIEIAN